MKAIGKCLIWLVVASVTSQVLAHGQDIDRILVEGRQVSLVGQALSASEGIVGAGELAIRPLSRTGEILELVPGMVVTQHSGSGKANQYFLRGFNLDHGTDFATYVDGMPINMVSHGHGQGYTDLNFLIPELVSKMDYKKGAYYADVGDFSGAGGVNISTANQLIQDQISMGIGENGYVRGLLVADTQIFGGNALLALEQQYYDGPWHDISEDLSKTNLVLKHTHLFDKGQVSLAFMAYDNQWNSADQIPARAVQSGLISRFGSLDESVGGESSRYSLSANWQHGDWSGSAYIIDYGLNLWSNFTYFLEDSVNGDQFEQVDDRLIYGGQLEYQFSLNLAGFPVQNRVGLQYREDDIQDVSLYHTKQRQRIGVTRSDSIQQSHASMFAESQIDWNNRLRTVLGARYDKASFDVKDKAGVNRFGVDLTDNSGGTSDDLLSLKGSIIISINEQWETYLSAGQGFHSNDARGTTIAIDPTSGEQANPVNPLVRSTGTEVGIRGVIHHHLNLSLALWTLDLDSELLFVGDAGNTEASAPSSRKGIEMVAYYYWNDYLSTDIEYAYTDSKLSNTAPDQSNIPGAVKDVLQLGMNLDLNEAWFGSLRYRYFGKRPLTEDDSKQADSLGSWNLRVGYQQPNWRVYLDLLNMTNSIDHDIEYFYESRLTSESQGVEDHHFHPIEPRTLRLSLGVNF